jgi:hypothetical protein
MALQARRGNFVEAPPELAQLERRKGLANDTVFSVALDGALRASRKAHPEATSMTMDEVLAFADPSAAGRGFYRKVPVAVGHERNRQLRRRR